MTYVVRRAMVGIIGGGQLGRMMMIAGHSLGLDFFVQADAADGMILARGGQSNGYALYLVEGKPTFTYTTPDGRRTFAAKKPIEGKRAAVAVRLTTAKRVIITVDGMQVAEGRVPQWIGGDPNDDMQIGDDLRSPVLETKVPALRGTIERVRIFSGEAPQE